MSASRSKSLPNPCSTVPLETIERMCTFQLSRERLNPPQSSALGGPPQSACGDYRTVIPVDATRRSVFCRTGEVCPSGYGPDAGAISSVGHPNRTSVR